MLLTLFGFGLRGKHKFFFSLHLGGWGVNITCLPSNNSEGGGKSLFLDFLPHTWCSPGPPPLGVTINAPCRDVCSHHIHQNQLAHVLAHLFRHLFRRQMFVGQRQTTASCPIPATSRPSLAPRQDPNALGLYPSNPNPHLPPGRNFPILDRNNCPTFHPGSYLANRLVGFNPPRQVSSEHGPVKTGIPAPFPYVHIDESTDNILAQCHG